MVSTLAFIAVFLIQASSAKPQDLNNFGSKIGQQQIHQIHHHYHYGWDKMKFLRDSYGILKGSLWDSYGTLTIFLQDSYGNLTGFLQDSYGNLTGFLQDSYENLKGSLQDSYGILTRYLWETHQDSTRGKVLTGP